MLIKTYGAAINGIEAKTITVEVKVDRGMKFFLVGLPDISVKESQQRIESAIESSGYKMPGKKVVINMAPADIRKEGAAYDLTIAIGILAASGQIKHSLLSDLLIMGELSLDGSVKSINGVLPIVLEAKKRGFKGVVLPKENTKEAAFVEGIDVYGVDSIKLLIDFLNNEKRIQPIESNSSLKLSEVTHKSLGDFSNVKGQYYVKRAFEIAAAGGHNILLVGAPGSGKTMLARCLPTILPPMTLEEAIETSRIHSVTAFESTQFGLRPFRSPHHSISDVALVGGGSKPKPGEISLAHNGVLFLDEFPEYKRHVLEVLRQPLEESFVSISRSRYKVKYPTRFMLVAAMNPCPCGYLNHPQKTCSCSDAMIGRYANKISGPLLDRIDMHVSVSPVKVKDMIGEAIDKESETSSMIKERVVKARDIQLERYKKAGNVFANAHLTSGKLKKYCVLDEQGKELIKVAIDKLGLSARGYDRALRVARTIADLAGSENIETVHISEAIQYRGKL